MTLFESPVAEAHANECLLRAGNTNCAGCGMSLGLRWFGEVFSEPEAAPTMVIPACCAIVSAGAFPRSAYAAPTLAATFASSAAMASGITAVRELNGDKRPVVCWAGDGGTYDIGLATLSAAAERNEDLIYICYDNEIYGNTGGQRSGATPTGVRTATTPLGKPEVKKDILQIMVAHRIPFAATLSLAHRSDFLRKLDIAKHVRGFRFLLMHSPCPTGWKSEPAESIELVSAAVRSGLFPLYEVYDGARYRINAEPDGTGLAEYINAQKRFGGEHFDVDAVRAQIKHRWDHLHTLARSFPVESEAK
jgi:pyruvate/2-oxoacid:ferredoxin oxidoreductase beta subunit